MDHSAATAAIAACYHRWFEAVMTGDMTPFAALLAPDFRYVDIFGAVRDGAGYHALLAEIPAGNLIMTLGALDTRPLGAVVCALGDYTVAGNLADGSDLSSHTRFTSLWSNGTGDWRCHGHHATSIVIPP